MAQILLILLEPMLQNSKTEAGPCTLEEIVRSIFNIVVVVVVVVVIIIIIIIIIINMFCYWRHIALSEHVESFDWIIENIAIKSKYTVK